MEEFIQKVVEYLPTILSTVLTGVCGIIFTKLKTKVEELTKSAKESATTELKETKSEITNLVNENKALRNDIHVLTDTISKVDHKYEE